MILNLFTLLLILSPLSFFTSPILKPSIFKFLTVLEKKLFSVSATSTSFEIIVSPSISVMFLLDLLLSEKMASQCSRISCL